MSERSSRIRAVTNKRRQPVMIADATMRPRKIGLIDTSVFLEPTEETFNWSLNAWIQHWLNMTKKGLVKPTTYDTLERVYRNHIQQTLGKEQLSDITSDMIQGLLLDLKENQGYSYSTVKKVYDLLNASLRYAVLREVLPKNPVDLVVMPKKALFPQKEASAFTIAECSRIIEEAQRETSAGEPVYWYGDAIILTMLTGVRLGELLGLRKQDYDPARKTLKVTRSVHKVNKRDENGNLLPGRTLEPTTTKSYSGNREIPLTSQAVQAIERMLAKHPLSESIVTSTKGMMATPEQMDRSFHGLLRNINMDSNGTGLHKLRHTFASLLFAHNVDVKSISKLLGHATVAVTLNVYVHLFEQVPYAAITPLEDLF